MLFLLLLLHVTCCCFCLGVSLLLFLLLSLPFSQTLHSRRKSKTNWISQINELYFKNWMKLDAALPTPTEQWAALPALARRKRAPACCFPVLRRIWKEWVGLLKRGSVGSLCFLFFLIFKDLFRNYVAIFKTFFYIFNIFFPKQKNTFLRKIFARKNKILFCSSNILFFISLITLNCH